MALSDHAVLVLVVSRDLAEIDLVSTALQDLCGSYQIFVDYAQSEKDLARKHDEGMSYHVVLIGEAYYREEGLQSLDQARKMFPDAHTIYVDQGRVVSALETCNGRESDHRTDGARFALRNAVQAVLHHHELSAENRRLLADLRAKDLELSIAVQRMDEMAGRQDSNGQSQGCLTLLSRIRHEVNNPLTGVLGQAQLLLRRADQLPEEARHRVETIEKLTLRISEVFRNFDQSPQSQSASL